MTQDLRTQTEQLQVTGYQVIRLPVSAVKRLGLLLVTVLLVTGNLMACDLCGCFMGIVPYDNQSGFSFLHRYRSFNGYAQADQAHAFFPQGAYLRTSPLNATTYTIPSMARVMHGDPTPVTTTSTASGTNSNKDYEIYKVYELRVKLFIHPRIELNAIAGINDNSSLENGVKANVSGISDVTVYAGYHVLRPADFSRFPQRLITGAGFKLPVGNYYATGSDGYRLPLLIQPGTGSTDYFGYVTYVIGYKRWGASINSMYKWNGTNYYGERIGNSISNFMNLFYKVPVKQVVLIPSVQFYYEYTKGMYVNDVLTPATAMNVLMAGPGMDAHYKNFAFNASFQLPVWEKTVAENLSSAGKMVVGISYYFNQRSYLLKSKQE